MAESTYRLTLLHDLQIALHMYLEVDTAVSSDIHVGDLIEMKITDKTCILMDDEEVTSGYKFVGISNSVWETGMDMSTLKKTIEVLGMVICQATVASAVYQIGDALEYDASADDGTLKSWDTGNQVIGWVIGASSVSAAITTLEVLVNILDPSSSLLEVSS